jgi:branched-subunit amino acid ABC-type transport system permease component
LDRLLYFFELERRAVGHAAFPAGRRLTLVFGIRDLVNLAHGSLSMLGA